MVERWLEREGVVRVMAWACCFTACLALAASAASCSCLNRLAEPAGSEPEKSAPTRVRPGAWGERADDEGGGAEAMKTLETTSSVHATVRKVEMDRRGQRAFWTVDLELRNGAAEPRWFVVSRTVEVPPAELTTAAGYTLFEAGGIPMLQLYGSPGVELVRLGAGQRLTLLGLVLESYELEAWTRLQVGVAASVKVSGQPVETRWLSGRDLATSGVADASKRRQEAEARNEGYRDEPLTFEGLSTLDVPLELAGVDLPPPLAAPP